MENTSVLNKMFIFLNYVVNGNSSLYFELDQAIDVDLLQKSLELLVERHPLLNRRLSKSFLGYQWTSSRDTPHVQLECQEYGSVDQDEIQNLLRKNAWQSEFKLFGEMHLKAYYIKGPTRCYVQLVPNHILADARSSDLLMSDLATIFDCLSRGAPIPEHPVTIRSDRGNLSSLFARDMSLARKLQLYILALIHIVVDACRREHGIAVDTNANRSRKRGATSVVSREIDGAFVETMKSRLKGNGFTMHPILVLAVLRAVEQYNKRRGKATKTIRVSDMFSLLPFAKQDLTNVYDCFVVPFTSYYKMCEDDMAMMSSIRDGVAYFKRGGILRELFRQTIYTYSGALLPKRFATNMVTRFIAKSNIVISNPGVVKFGIPDFGTAKVLSYTSVSQLFPPARIFFLFSTFKNQLRLNILYDENAFSAEEVESEIYADFLANLRNISDLLIHPIDAPVDSSLAPQPIGG